MYLSQPSPLTSTGLLLGEGHFRTKHYTHIHTHRQMRYPASIGVQCVCFQEMRVGICFHSAAVCLFEQSAAPSEGGAALVSEI